MRARPFVILLAALTVSVFGPAVAAAEASDAASTQAYLQANYALAHYFAAHIHAAEGELSRVLAGVRHECPHAAAESPQDVDSEQLSNEVIGTMVSTVAQHNLAPTRSFERAVAHLRWSSGALTRSIRAYVANGKVLTSLAVPHLCADVKVWVASAFQTLPASTVRFDQRFMPNWVAPGYLPGALAQYETPAERALARRTNQLEEQWTDFEARAVETWGAIMDELNLEP